MTYGVGDQTIWLVSIVYSDHWWLKKWQYSAFSLLFYSSWVSFESVNLYNYQYICLTSLYIYPLAVSSSYSILYMPGYVLSLIEGIYCGDSTLFCVSHGIVLSVYSSIRDLSRENDVWIASKQ